MGADGSLRGAAVVRLDRHERGDPAKGEVIKETTEGTNMIQLIFALVIIGVALYLVETYIPMSQPIKIVIRVVVILAIVYYLLQMFGMMGGRGPILH
jgi:hypothetical protein